MGNRQAESDWNGQFEIFNRMAVRIARATGTTPESWLNIQVKLDLFDALRQSMDVTEFEQPGV